MLLIAGLGDYSIILCGLRRGLGAFRAVDDKVPWKGRAPSGYVLVPLILGWPPHMVDHVKLNGTLLAL